MTETLTIDNPAYFDRLAEIEEHHWWSLGVWRLGASWLEDALRGRRGLRAIDVGCGTGMTVRRLSRLPMIEEIVGLDPSPEALAHSRRRHAFPTFQGSVLDLPFDDGRFDVATFFDVLQHVPNPARALDELHRILVPGGVLLLRSNGRGWSGNSSAYRLTELVEQIESSGFRVVRASYANMLPAMLQEVRGRLGSRTKGSHPAGRGLRISLPHPATNLVLLGISSCEAFLAGRLDRSLPFGHSTMVLATR